MNQAARDELWNSLSDLSAARRTVSLTVRDSMTDVENYYYDDDSTPSPTTAINLVQNCLESLAVLELWRANILDELGVPDRAIQTISSFLSFLEPTHQTEENVAILGDLGLLEPELDHLSPELRQARSRLLEELGLPDTSDHGSDHDHDPPDRS